MMKKRKRRINVFKIAVTVAGVLTALAAIGALLTLLKKRAEKKKEAEAKIEEEIRAVIEKKFAEIDEEETAPCVEE